MKKYYVYSRYIGSGSVGREDLSGVYDSWELAIERVTALYNMDRKNAATKGQSLCCCVAFIHLYFIYILFSVCVIYANSQMNQIPKSIIIIRVRRLENCSPLVKHPPCIDIHITYKTQRRTKNTRSSVYNKHSLRV